MSSDSSGDNDQEIEVAQAVHWAHELKADRIGHRKHEKVKEYGEALSVEGMLQILKVRQ